VKSAETKRRLTRLRALMSDLGNRLKRRIQHLVGKTHGPEVLGKIGGFGGLFAPNFSGMACACCSLPHRWRRHKIKIAFALNKHDTVGADLVNHCVNDIGRGGRAPTFLSRLYRLRKTRAACLQSAVARIFTKLPFRHCALIGGGNGQMPGMYRKGEYDLAGCIIGVVDRSKIINGRKIKPGDVILGLASNVCIPTVIRSHARFCSRKCGSRYARVSRD